MRIKLTLRRPEDRMTDLEVTADATATVADVANALYLADPLRSEVEPPEGLTLQVQDPGAGPGAKGVRSLDREVEIVRARLPQVSERLTRRVVEVVQHLRREDRDALVKQPLDGYFRPVFG